MYHKISYLAKHDNALKIVCYLYVWEINSRFKTHQRRLCCVFFVLVPTWRHAQVQQVRKINTEARLLFPHFCASSGVQGPVLLLLIIIAAYFISVLIATFYMYVRQRSYYVKSPRPWIGVEKH